MTAVNQPIFETCGCEVDFTPGTLSRRQPPLSYTRAIPGCGTVHPAQNITSRCEHHQTQWLKSHEEGLLEYMNLRVNDAESKLGAAGTHEGMYSKRELTYKKRQLKAETTIRNLAALGLWSRYPATWGLCAVSANEGGETRLVKLEDVMGMADENAKKLGEGWEDEGEDGGGGCEDQKDGEESAVDGNAGRTQTQNARLRASLGREGHSRAVDQKWYWWW